MDSKLFRLCMIATMALGVSACDNGSDEDRDDKEPQVCQNTCSGNLSIQCQPDGSVSPVDCSSVGGCDVATGLCKAQNVAECTDGAKKCENNAEWSCSNGHWVLGNSCSNGCSGDACAANPAPGCGVGQMKCENDAAFSCINGTWIQTQVCTNGCNPDTNLCNAGSAQVACTGDQTQCNGNYVETCVGGAWVQAANPCENGCDKGACKGAAQTECEGNATQCNGAYVQSCVNGHWMNGASACPNGCDKGACKEATVEEDVACKGVTCKTGTCDRGVCVTDAMKAAKEGDKCDDTFVEFCNGDVSMYCSNTGTVVATDCANDGGCVLISEEYQGETYISSWCRGPADKCKNADDEINYCTTYTDATQSLDYESYYVCTEATDGKLAAVDYFLYGEYDLCSGSCNAEKTECEGGSSSGACNYDTKCVGNTLYECVDLSMLGMGTMEFDDDCAEAGMACGVINGVAGCHETCTAESAPVNTCSVDEKYGNNVSVSSACVKGDDNKLYLNEVEMSCAAACENGLCVRVDENEGKACDYMTEDDHCSGNVILECGYSDTWEATDCTYSYGANYVCDDSSGTPECVLPCTAADAAAQKTTSKCEYSSYYSAYVQYNYVCKDAGNGKYTYQQEGGKYCGDKCDEDGIACVKVLENEGEACDDTYQEKCEGNIVSYCSNKQVTALNCGLSAGYSCHYFSSVKMADCAKDTDVCTTAGETSSVCKDSLLSSSTQNYVCLAADDGKNYVMPDGKAVDCGNAYCNAAGTACEGSSASDDDTLYDCSSAQLQSGGTAGDYCKNKDASKPLALCIPCNEHSIIACGSSANIGQHAGTDKCDAAESGYFECGTYKYSETQTIAQYCSANKPNSVGVCETDTSTGKTYFECAPSCTTLGTAGTGCAEFSDGVYSYPTMCTAVGSVKVMLDASTNASDYTECATTCNAAETACK